MGAVFTNFYISYYTSVIIKLFYGRLEHEPGSLIK